MDALQNTLLGRGWWLVTIQEGSSAVVTWTGGSCGWQLTLWHSVRRIQCHHAPLFAT